MKVVLTVIEGPHAGRIFEFDRHDTFIVGRAKAAQFRLSDDDEFFSRNHFLMEVNPPLCRILDLSSTNGTRVNGKSVTSTDLRNGDIIRGGRTKLRVSIQNDEASVGVALSDTPSQTPLHVGDATIVPRNWPQRSRPVEGEAERSAAPTQDLASENPQTLAPAPLPVADSPVRRQAKSSDAALPSFPGYRTLQVLGRGGMGIVYEAESVSDGSHVAVKVVSPNAAATSNDLERFIREATILKELRHPHIVGFRELNQSEGCLFFVMDYVPGKNAEAMLKELKTPMSVGRAVSWIIQLLDALKYAHGCGYVHRDVKPTNLLITGTDSGEKLFLADFGLSRAYQSSKISGLTMTGDIGGSTPFMPPEQITDYRNVDPSADQYSAAASLYYLLTGHNVYNFSRDIARQLLMILQDKPVPIESRRSDLPASLVSVIHKALSRAPKERFPDVTAFQQALRPSMS